ncbi:MAG: hypothetical protein ABIS18_08815 [Actinomycetota bacterium]
MSVLGIAFNRAPSITTDTLASTQVQQVQVKGIKLARTGSHTSALFLAAMLLLLLGLSFETISRPKKQQRWVPRHSVTVERAWQW